MLGKFFECEADKKINFNAEQQIDMGGFCVSTFDYIFRWLIRGDTLCKAAKGSPASFSATPPA